MSAVTIQLGTSGWQYPHWQGVFYPKGLARRQWLGYYASQFSCVEINNSFYRLPESASFEKWLEATPAEFRFALKAPRIITHYKKLKSCENQLDVLLTRLARLGERIGPLLFQLPPRWRCNTRRLGAFLERLSGPLRFAFEFRDPSWHCREVYDLLRAHRAAFCIFDKDGHTTALETTADFVYVRLHGPTDAHTGNYHPQTLRGWAVKAKGWQREGKDVFLFFDNDAGGYAAKNAQRIRRYFG